MSLQKNSVQSQELRLWGLVLMAIALRFVWMGDASFLVDEASLMSRAFEHNLNASWASAGLEGTRGLVYGPLVTWIFQIYLKIGAIFGASFLFYFYLNAFLHSAMWLVGVLWLKQLFRWLPVWMILSATLSPFFFQYSRMLWDNPFLVEFSLLLFCVSWSFLLTPKTWKLALAVFLAASALMVHLMVVPMVLSLFVLVIHSQRSWLLRHRKTVLTLFVAALVYSFPYLSYLSEDSQTSSAVGAGFGAINAKFLEGLLLGFSSFSHLGGGYLLDKTAPSLVLTIAHVCAVAGVLFGFFFLYRLFASVVMDKDVRHEDRKLFFFFRVFWMVLFPFAFLAKLGGQPHYFNGSWLAFFLLTSWSIHRFFENMPYRSIFALFVGGLAFVGVENQLIYHHYNKGSRGKHYGPTIANQYVGR